MGTAVTQPATLKSQNGVIVTAGIYLGRDFGALVQPFATNGAPDAVSACADAVVAFRTHITPLLLDCISQDASMAYVQASGMVHGNFVPYREDYVIGANPGTRAVGLAQGQISGLCLMYCSNNAPKPAGRMQIGKAFVPGLCDDDLDVDEVDMAVVAAIEAMESACANGMAGGLNTWYRCGSANHTTGQTLPQVIWVEGQFIVATQRRRIRRLGA